MPQSNQVDRRIYFFKASFRYHDVQHGTWTDITNPDTIFSNIKDLDFDRNDPNSRYLPDSDANHLIMFVDEIAADQIKGRMAVSRRSALPEVERTGTVTDLLIPTDAGLIEISHFILFKQQNILAVEFNFYGPRASAISYYLMNKAGAGVTTVSFEPYLAGDVAHMIRRTGSVKLVSIAVHRDRRDVVRELDEGLAESLDALANVGEAEQLEVTIRTPRRKQGFFLAWLQRIPALLASPANRDAFGAFALHVFDAETGKLGYFDLLKDKLISVKKVLREADHKRSIRSTSMYAAIQEAYYEMREHLV